jgi:lipoate-protein ligase A
MRNMKEWRLVVDRAPQKGSWNMAADEYLFQSLGEDPVTSLRFYQWEEPTVSIGYSQKLNQLVDLDKCRSMGIALVRRITGGKLVLHHQEVTYSVCSSDSGLFTSKLMDSYRLISEALMRGLEKMGIPCSLAASTSTSYARGLLPCFSHPAQNEIEVNGKKIIGSAQKRTGSQFIQHGSIPLKKDESLLQSISKLNQEGFRMSWTSLSDTLGREVDFDWVVENLRSGISEYFNIRLNFQLFSEEEKKAIKEIQVKRYDNPAWTYRINTD